MLKAFATCRFRASLGLAPILALLLSLHPGFAPDGHAASSEAAQFNRDVRPILSDNCFACHGPDTKKVKGGLRLDLREQAIKPAKSGEIAIIPGQAERSELIARIFATDPDDVMPPPDSHKTLTSGQKELLRRWIAQGAEYQGHWAYLAPVKPAVPGFRNGIDFLVRRRLQALNLQPSPEADRRTLARRLYFDLD